MIIPKDDGYFKNFQGHDRFDVPEPVYRVTAGYGGEAYLIIGEDKVALYDCGMACFSEGLISNIHEVLDPLGKKPDYCLMSHSHYDHIGALPYVIKEWPDIIVCGAPKCEQVFNSEAARKTMVELGNNARDLYHCDCPPVIADGLRVDRKMEEGEEIDLGGITVKYFEAKGHTDCSVVYMVYPQKILFANESAAQLRGPGEPQTSCLKSFTQSIRSAEKMAALEPDHIIGMHYGYIDPSYNKQFFIDFIKEAEWELGLITRAIRNGYSDEEVCSIHESIYWDEARRVHQPYDANHLNTMIIIKRVRKTMEAGYGEL